MNIKNKDVRSSDNKEHFKKELNKISPTNEKTLKYGQCNSSYLDILLKLKNIF